MRRRLSIFFAVACAGALLSAAAAYAAFSSGASAAQAVSTDSLQPPTNLQGAVGSSCKKVTLTWTASASSYASGYTILRNGVTLGSVAAGVTTYVDNGASKTTSYTYAVLTTFQQWSAGQSLNVTTC